MKMQNTMASPQVGPTLTAVGAGFLDTPAIKAAEDIKVKHRNAFNLKAFGVDPKLSVPVFKGKNKSLQMDDATWQYHVNILRNWIQDEKSKEVEFRQKNKKGYTICKNLEVEKIKKPDGDFEWQLRKIRNKKKAGGTIIIPIA